MTASSVPWALRVTLCSEVQGSCNQAITVAINHLQAPSVELATLFLVYVAIFLNVLGPYFISVKVLAVVLPAFRGLPQVLRPSDPKLRILKRGLLQGPQDLLKLWCWPETHLPLCGPG